MSLTFSWLNYQEGPFPSDRETMQNLTVIGRAQGTLAPLENETLLNQCLGVSGSFSLLSSE